MILCSFFSQNTRAFFFFFALYLAEQFGSVLLVFKQEPDYRIAPNWTAPRIHQGLTLFSALRVSQLHQTLGFFFYPSP